MHQFSEINMFVRGGSILVILLGLGVLIRGLNGGRHGVQGLLRPSAGTLARAEGWRITIVGMTLTVLGLGGVLELRWIVFIAIGFGLVKFIEATAILAAWRSENQSTVRRTEESTPTSRSDRSLAH